MARPNKREALVRAARQGQPFTRVQVPKLACSRCGSEVYANADGGPRPHLRPAVQGDPGWSELVPVRVGCD
jgi:hypothetical protein